MNTKETGLEIAVIGLSGKFPGALNVAEFWENLAAGRETVEFLNNEELAGVNSDLKSHPAYVPAKGGLLRNKEYFDEAFFGYTPSEAKLMDPQVRIMHELAWEALEDAGYNSVAYPGRIAFFGGASQNLKWQAMAFPSEDGKMLGDFSTALLANKDFICTRIAYKLNLKGPAIYVSTACSTSLVAVHQACRSLLNGECSMALAGGISVSPASRNGYIYQEGMINSADGHCRSFDARSTGTVGGEGGGVVVLKLLEEARKDGDHIYAVIKGSAVNNDGHMKVGFTAPSIESQSQVIRAALKFSEVEAETIGYVETHGSGTMLGDPIEIEALKKAFNTGRNGFCAIGAVKSNIGHLDAGAGISGFIKCVLSLKNKQIPASLHFETPNPKIDFKNSPFYVNTSLQPWVQQGYPRRAGVSSFGIGGTNAHVVLEEYEMETPRQTENKPRLFPLSARSAEALEAMTQNLGEFLSRQPVDLDTVSYTLQTGRRAFEYRKTVVASTQEELISALQTSDAKKTQHFYTQDVSRDLVFMFPGIGSQYVNVARGLYENEPAFAKHVNHCLEIIRQHTGADFKQVLYPDTAGTELENDFEKGQLLTFIIEYSLAKLLMDWGIKPSAFIGYSFGEYVAACLAGVFNLNDAIFLVVERGKLVKNILPGEMLSIPLPEDKVLAYLNGSLSITISNGPSTIVAGEKEAIDELHTRLKNDGLLCMKVNTQYAIHSKMAEPIAEDFRRILSMTSLHEPSIPMMLNATGAWATGKELATPDYWVNHLLHTVRFGKGLKALLATEHTVFAEIGPGRSLSNMLRQLPERKMNHLVVSTLPGNAEASDDYRYFLGRLGQLWLYNQTVDWKAAKGEGSRYKTSLPTYPFQRNRHWLAEPVLTSKTPANEKSWRQNNIKDWFYTPTWKRSAFKAQASPPLQRAVVVLLAGEDDQLTSQLVKEATSADNTVVIVRQGGQYKQEDGTCTLDPLRQDHYERLFKDLASRKLVPTHVIHAWNIAKQPVGNNRSHAAQNQYYGLYSILFLIKALVPHQPERLTINIAGSYLFQVTGDEYLDPTLGTLQGMLPVIQQEFSFIRCCLVDLPWGCSTPSIARQLLQESTALNVAYRGNFRWELDYQPAPLETSASVSPVFRKEGVYMITGGLGKIGLTIASHLAEQAHAKVVLVSRAAFPPENEWSVLKNDTAADPQLRQKLDQLMKISKNGELMICQADVSDADAMRSIREKVMDRFGAVHGVIHAAGVVKGKSIQCPVMETTINECIEQLRPKMLGTLVLDEIFANDPLDFILCTSSLSPILGGLGFFAYASSSSFLDAFVLHKRKTDQKWLSVNWADWKFSDGAVNGAKDFTITPNDGIETLNRIVANREIGQVVVSAGLLKERIGQWVNLREVREEGSGKQEKTLQERPVLLNAYTEPATSLEKEIAALWGNFFGYEKIGSNDNFFELGGDSLKALVMLSRIHKQFGEALPLGAFFKEATVANIARLMKQSGRKTMLTLRHAEKKEYYPLSSAQRRLFFYQLLNPDSVAYNETRIIDVSDSLRYDDVVNLLNQLIERHEIFRTTFHLVQDQPAQVVHDSLVVSPQTVRCAENEVDRHIREFIKPFALHELPMVRTRLLDVDSGRKILLVDMPHIITDGVSINIFFEEFFKLYNREVLPDIDYTFKDFCEWQVREAFTAKVNAQKQYWKEKLRPVEAGFFLQTEKGAKRGDGTGVAKPIVMGSTAEITQVLQKFNTTYFILMLSCFYVLLSKISNKSKVLIGTVTAGRNLADIENVLGLFINIIPLYKEVHEDSSFADFLQQVASDTLQDFDHQDIHFEELIKELPVQGHNPDSPLFNVMLVSYAGKYKSDGKSQKATQYLNDRHSSRYDFTLLLLQDDDHYKISAEYASGAFKSETVDRMINYLHAICKQIIKDPGLRIGDIQLMGEELRTRVLKQFRARPGSDHHGARRTNSEAALAEPAHFDFE